MPIDHQSIINNAVKVMRETDELVASVRAQVASYSQHTEEHVMPRSPQPPTRCGPERVLNHQHVGIGTPRVRTAIINGNAHDLPPPIEFTPTPVPEVITDEDYPEVK